MAKPKKMAVKGLVGEHNQNRVMVFLIDAPRRPYISLHGPFTVDRPADWTDFGFDACMEEIERRKAIANLLTEDERKFFDRYCRARDDS